MLTPSGSVAARRRARVAVAMLVVALRAGTASPSEASQAQSGQPPARLEPGLTIEAVGFCSSSRPRTSNARLTWRATTTALGADVANLSAATQRVEATVFKNGFDRGLFVALPVAAGAGDRPVAAVAQAPVAQQLTTRRAFQIRMTAVTAAPTPTAGDAGSEMEAVVENLEPGVTYTWRLAVDAPTGRIVSRPVTLRAPICPTDGADPLPTTAPRRQP
jgi:hypothetical protein